MRMKKILTVLAVSLSMSVGAQNDAFFGYEEVNQSGIREGNSLQVGGTTFGINQMETNQDLPVGSGLFLLMAAGLGYVTLKRKEQSK